MYYGHFSITRFRSVPQCRTPLRNYIKMLIMLGYRLGLGYRITILARLGLHPLCMYINYRGTVNYMTKWLGGKWMAFRFVFCNQINRNIGEN